MPEITRHTPGTFCWIELGTTDQTAAKDFYSKLFGWSVNDIPMGEGAVYSMLQLKGKDVGALYKMGEELTQQGIPPHWLPYVSVTDVDEITNKARQLGANVIMEPFDVFDSGKMAIIQEPGGAVAALWQPKAHIGVGIANEPGSLCWVELLTHNTTASKDFYSSLFGWIPKGEEAHYTEFTIENTSYAGMMQIQKEWGEVPPYWGVYFMVEDCEGTIAKAVEMGAKVIVPGTDIEGIGRFATLQDPQGAVFSIIQGLQQA